MKAQRGTIKQLVSKNGLLDDCSYFTGVTPAELRKSINFLTAGFWAYWEDEETQDTVTNEIVKSAEGKNIQAETWREFFKQADDTHYSKLVITKNDIIKLSHPAPKTIPMTAEERVCKEEHKQLVKLAKEKGHTTPLKMWEENHWKDGHGRWHKENNDDWNAETGIGERLPEIYAEQMEKEVQYKATVYEKKRLAEALNFEQMSVTKLLELEPDYPALHGEFKEYLHAQSNQWVEKIFWEEYELAKAGNEAEF